MFIQRPELSICHANDAVQATVRDWFDGKIGEKILEGKRSVLIAHPEKADFWLKIKGAGYKGGPIKFGKLYNSRLKAPVFDFDGRMMEDVASGHDNAYMGGASFQQAVVEHRVSRILRDSGYNAVPCLGYGQARRKGKTSWFSLFEIDRSWETLVVPRCSMEEYAAAKIRMGQFITDLAINQGLIGHCWYLKAPQGPYVLKDLHPFRSLDSVNMSQVSWVMQVFFMLHIVALAALHFSRDTEAGSAPEDIQAYPFRSFVPDAKKSEHEELRWSLVVRYMLEPPQQFDQHALLGVLRSNRITNTLMEMCPDDFARADIC